MLHNPNEPVSDLSYFDCIESVMGNSKVGPQRCSQNQIPRRAPFHPGHPLLSVQVLGESMAGISMNCKNGDVAVFGDCVASASRALCGLTEAAGQARCSNSTSASCYCLFLLMAVFCAHRQPTWLVCQIPTVRQDIRAWWIQSSLPKPTRQSIWPVRILSTQRAVPPRYTNPRCDYKA